MLVCTTGVAASKVKGARTWSSLSSSMLSLIVDVSVPLILSGLPVIALSSCSESAVSSSDSSFQMGLENRF
eukprot:89713-Karenia_brevis.AAC.1